MNEEKTTLVGKIINFVLVMLIVIFLFIVLAVLIRLDVGGVGSNFARPLLKNIPYVNKILPPVSDAQISEEKGYSYRSLEEANAEIERLKKELSDTKKSLSKKKKSVIKLQNEIDKLSQLEKNNKDFEERVYNFDKNVVYNDKAPSIEEYKAFYEEIEPENAEKLYKEVVSIIEANGDIKSQAERFQAMKPEEAAAIITNMSADLDLVCDILSKMKSKNSAAILAKLDSVMAARITKKMSLKNAKIYSEITGK